MISEEEKDAIDVLENVFIFKNTNDRFTKLDLKCINIALNLIKTQNKMIELMADILSNLGRYDYEGYFKEDVIEEIRKKVEDDGDE